MDTVSVASDYINGYVPYNYGKKVLNYFPVIFTEAFVRSYKNSNRVLKVFYVSFDVDKYDTLKSYYDNMTIEDGIVTNLGENFNTDMYEKAYDDFLMNGASPRVFTIPTEFIDREEFALEVTMQFSEAGLQSLARSSLYGELRPGSEPSLNNHRVKIKNGDTLGGSGNQMVILFKVASTEEIDDDGNIDWYTTTIKVGESQTEISRPFFAALYSASATTSESIAFTYGQVDEDDTQSLGFKMQPGIRNIVKLNYNYVDDGLYSNSEMYAGLEHAATFILNDKTPIPLFRHRHKTAHMRFDGCTSKEKENMCTYYRDYIGEELEDIYTPVDAMAQRNAYYKRYSHGKQNGGYVELCTSCNVGDFCACTSSIFPSYDGFYCLQCGCVSFSTYLKESSGNSSHVGFGSPSEVYTYSQENVGGFEAEKNGIISTIGLGLSKVSVGESYVMPTCNSVSVLLSFRGI